MKYFLPVQIAFSVLVMLLASCVSCSREQAQLLSAHGKLVFDYADAESKPSMSLSVVLETQGMEGVERLKIVHNESQYEWESAFPSVVVSSWSSYTEFVAVDNAPVPQGAYTVYYTDVGGESYESSFTVHYPEELPAANAADAARIMEAQGGVRRVVAAYAKDGTLLYFDEEKDGWRENAVSARICYVLDEGGVMCMLPEKNVSEE